MLQSFKPIIDEECRVLILGSMPGVKSLQDNEYYAHPRNAFWRILYTLFEEAFSEDYNMKKEFLKRHHIALWDVIAECEREGSLDSAIKKDEPNDFDGLFKKYPNIKVVFFNGTKAQQTFARKVGFEFEGIQFHRLCSTSPAHAISFERKLREWRVIKEELAELG